MRDLPFADIHCHPTLYAFNRMRNTPELESDPDVFHPWFECTSNLDDMIAGGRGTSYSQGNFPRMIEGNVKLAFHSFTPIEKGFFSGSSHDDERPFFREIWRWCRGKTPVAALGRLLKKDVDGAAREVTGLLRNDGPLRQLIQHLVMQYPFARVKFLTSQDYDYWEELHAEYEFLKSRNGVDSSAEIVSPDGPKVVTGRYQIVATAEELEESFERDDEVALALTIEGGHVFSVGRDLEPLSVEEITKRIGALKKWEHPILFLTLAHHFDNGLCGHAHSLLDAADWIMDQEARLNEDFDSLRGIHATRELLDLDEDLRDRGGRRIVLDVRHMSARTRKTYYDEIVGPYNRWRGEQDEEYRQRYPKIPVVMSHGGYAGVPSLEQMIADQDKESDHWHRGGYYAWNINLSDEDIRVIHDTGGLAGLCFDRRILGMGPRQKIHDDLVPELLIKHIFAMVDVVMVDDRIDGSKKHTIWDCITIGSDFDGVIHPLQAYPTALELTRFSQDLRRRLEQEKHTRMILEIGVDEIVEKIAWKNAFEFARKHLPAAGGVSRSQTKKVKEKDLAHA